MSVQVLKTHEVKVGDILQVVHTGHVRDIVLVTAIERYDPTKALSHGSHFYVLTDDGHTAIFSRWFVAQHCRLASRRKNCL